MDMSTYERAKYKELPSFDGVENPVASVKKDGAHFVLSFDSEGNPSYVSRRESVTGTYPDRTIKLPHLVKKIPQLANNVYSLELIHTGHNTGEDAFESHPALSGILNSLPPKALSTQKLTGPIRGVLIDVKTPALNTYAEKIEHLRMVEQAFGDSNLLFTPTFVQNKDAINKLLEETKLQGREGVVVTSLTKPESENYRIKIKHLQTYNLKIADVLQEFDKNGNPKDSMGALALEDGSGRNVGKVGTGFTYEDRQDFWKNKKTKIGKLVQIICMTPTASQIRSARYNGYADGSIDTI